MISYLNLSRRRPISYRNQSINLQSKSMACFLYDSGLRREGLRGCNNASEILLDVSLIFPN